MTALVKIRLFRLFERSCYLIASSQIQFCFSWTICTNFSISFGFEATRGKEEEKKEKENEKGTRHLILRASRTKQKEMHPTSEVQEARKPSRCVYWPPLRRGELSVSKGKSSASLSLFCASFVLCTELPPGSNCNILLSWYVACARSIGAIPSEIRLETASDSEGLDSRSIGGRAPRYQTRIHVSKHAYKTHYCFNIPSHTHVRTPPRAQ